MNIAEHNYLEKLVIQRNDALNEVVNLFGQVADLTSQLAELSTAHSSLLQNNVALHTGETLPVIDASMADKPVDTVFADSRAVSQPVKPND